MKIKNIQNNSFNAWLLGIKQRGGAAADGNLWWSCCWWNSVMELLLMETTWWSCCWWKQRDGASAKLVCFNPENIRKKENFGNIIFTFRLIGTISKHSSKFLILTIPPPPTCHTSTSIWRDSACTTGFSVILKNNVFFKCVKDTIQFR